MTIKDATLDEGRAAEEPITAHVVSHIHGRMRVRLDRKHRHMPETMARIREHLPALRGVHRLELNLSSGSVLIHYDPDRQSRSTLVAALQVLRIATPHESELGPTSEYSEIEVRLIELVDALDRWIARVTGRVVDLRVLVPVGFVAGGIALAVAQGGLGLLQVPAFVFLWIGFDAFLQLHKTRTHVAPAFAEARA